MGMTIAGDLSDLLRALAEKGESIQAQLEKAHGEVDSRFEKPIALIKQAQLVVETIGSNPFISKPKVVDPNPHNWFLTLPSAYAPGKMTYSDAQFTRFAGAVDLGNETMWKLMEIYVEEAKRDVLSNAIAGNTGYHFIPDWSSSDERSGDHPVRVHWKTFALPNFLDKPLIGRQRVKFMHAIGSKDGDGGHLKGKEYWFHVADSEGSMRPIFSGKGDFVGYSCPAYEKMDALIKSLNPKEYVAEQHDR